MFSTWAHGRHGGGLKVKVSHLASGKTEMSSNTTTPPDLSISSLVQNGRSLVVMPHGDVLLFSY